MHMIFLDAARRYLAEGNVDVARAMIDAARVEQRLNER